MNPITYVILYLAAINLFAFILMGYDKHQAKRQNFRIPEANLFLTALFGGSIGSIIGMQFFRHKTRHLSFKIGMPAILILHIIIALVIYLLPVQFTVL